MVDEMYALLLVDTPHVRDNRFELLPQQESVSQRVLVGELLLDRLGCVAPGNEPIDFWVPPACATGAHSVAIITTYIDESPLNKRATAARGYRRRTFNWRQFEWVRCERESEIGF